MILKESVCFVLKKSLQGSSCQKWINPSPHWLRREFGPLLLAEVIDKETGSWGGVWSCSLMHVNNGFSVWGFGFGTERRWEVGECPHLWWAASSLLLVPALSNLVLKLCGAITQTALLPPAVEFSFQWEKSCVVVRAIKTEAISHSWENSTLYPHRFSALIKELNKDGPVPVWECLGPVLCYFTFLFLYIPVLANVNIWFSINLSNVVVVANSADLNKS